MILRRFLPIGAVAIAHFATSIVLAAYLWAHGMNQEPETAVSQLAGAILPVLHTPFVPRFWVGAFPTTVALNSLIWGITLGFAAPAAWRALRAPRAAA